MKITEDAIKEINNQKEISMNPVLLIFKTKCTWWNGENQKNLEQKQKQQENQQDKNKNPKLPKIKIKIRKNPLSPELEWKKRKFIKYPIENAPIPLYVEIDLLVMVDDCVLDVKKKDVDERAKFILRV